MLLIETLTVLFQSKTDDLDAKSKKSKKNLDDLGFAASKAGALMGVGFAAGSAAFNQLSAAIQTIPDHLIAAVNLADDLEALSKSTGVAIPALYELRFIATKCDTEFESLTSVIPKMVTSLSKATDATSAQSKALKELGIDTQEILNQSPEDAFYSIVEALGAVESEYDRARLGTAFFGKAFKDVNGLILEGADGLKELRDRFKEMGAVQNPQALLDLKDTFDELGFLVENASAQFAMGLAPSLEVVADQFLDIVKVMTDAESEMDGLIKAGQIFGETFIGALDLAKGAFLLFKLEMAKFNLESAKGGAVGAGMFGIGVEVDIPEEAFQANLQAAQDEVDKLEKQLAEKTGLEKLRENIEAAKQDVNQGPPVKLPVEVELETKPDELDKLIKTLEEELEYNGEKLAPDEKKLRVLQKKSDTDFGAIEESRGNIDGLKEHLDFLNEPLRNGMDPSQLDPNSIDDIKQTEQQIAEEEAKLRLLEEQFTVDQERLKTAEDLFDIVKKQREEEEAKKKQLEDEKKAEAEWERMKNKYMDDALSNDEKYKQAQSEIDALYSNGDLTAEQANRAEKKAFDDIYGDQKEPELKFAGAMEFNSQEAASTLMTQLFGGQKVNDPNKKVYEETKRSRESLDRIEKKLPKTTVLSLKGDWWEL